MADCIYINDRAKRNVHLFSWNPFFWPIHQSRCEATETYVKDILEKEIKESGILISAKYLLKLVNDSGMSIKDVQSILSIRDNNGNKIGIKVLWLYCLLKKIQKQKLMSPRYDDFLRAALFLLKTGKINISTNQIDSGKQGQNGCEYFEFKNQIDIKLFSEVFNSKELTVDLERGLVHELYHAYQDWEKRSIYRSRMEAEGELAGEDYILFTYPDHLSNYWIEIVPHPGWPSAKMGLRIPREIVEKLKNKPANSKEMEYGLNNIGQNIFHAEAFLYGFNAEFAKYGEQRFFAYLERKHPKNPGQYFTKEVQKFVDQFKQGYEKHGKLDYFKVGPNEFFYSPVARRYLSVTRAYLIKRWLEPSRPRNQETYKQLQNYFNAVFEYFVKYTQLPKTGKESPMDYFRTFDGIK